MRYDNSSRSPRWVGLHPDASRVSSARNGQRAQLRYPTTHLSPTLRAIDVNMLLDPGRLKAAFLSNMFGADAPSSRTIRLLILSGTQHGLRFIIFTFIIMFGIGLSWVRIPASGYRC